MGTTGLSGWGAAYKAMHECDVLLLLGTDFPYESFMPASPKIVYGCELKNPNFAALAEAAGLTGLRVEDPKEVRSALERTLDSQGPVLVDVTTDPNVLSMPPKATIQQAKRFALAMTKMAFTGEVEDVLDTVAANWRNMA